MSTRAIGQGRYPKNYRDKKRKWFLPNESWKLISQDHCKICMNLIGAARVHRNISVINIFHKSMVVFYTRIEKPKRQEADHPYNQGTSFNDRSLLLGP